MKYKGDQNKNEAKSLLKNTHKKHDLLNNHENNLLTNKFLTFLKIINISIFAYIIFSSIFYLIVHFYGKTFIKGKSVRLEYDTLLHQNLFVNFYFVLTTVLGFLTISKKSINYFLFYYFTMVLYGTVFTISYFSTSSTIVAGYAAFSNL